MIKQLLSCLLVAGAVSFGAYAQTDIAGDYLGTINVTLDPMGNPVPQPAEENKVITLTKAEDNTYALSIKDFTFQNIPVGDLEFPGLTATEAAGVVMLEAADIIEGPNIGGSLPTELELGSANVEGSNLQLELIVLAGGSEESEPLMVAVEFEGVKQASGINGVENDKLDILISDEAIHIKGEAKAYTIFNTAGTVMQSGAVNDNTISTADLKGGIYIIKVDKHIVKFIKK